MFLFTGRSAVPETSYTFDNVIHDWIFWGALFIVPVFAFLVIRKQRISTVGMKKLNTGKNIAISLIIINIWLWVKIGLLEFESVLSTCVLIIWLLERRNPNSNEIEIKSLLDEPEESKNKIKKLDEFIQGLYLRPLMLGMTVIGVCLILLGPHIRDGNDPMREFILGYSFLFFLFALFIILLKFINWKFSDHYSKLTKNQYLYMLIQSRFLVGGSLIVVVTSLINYFFLFFTSLHIVYFTLTYFILMLFLVGFLDIFLVLEFFYFRSQEGDKTKNINYSVLLSILSIFSVLGILFYVLLGGVFRTGEPFLSWSGLNGLTSTFAIGFGEELLFRGLLQFRFVEWMGEKKGIVTTSILFTLMHLPMVLLSFELFQGNLAAISFFMFYLLYSGIFLGFLVHRTKNISGAVILHAVSDLL